MESLLGYINIIEIRIRPADPHYFVVFRTKMAVSNHLHGTQGPELPGLPGFICYGGYLLRYRSLSQVCACLTDTHTWCRSWHSFIHSKSRLIQVLMIVANQRPFAVLLNGPIPVVTEALLPHHTKHGHSPSQENKIWLTMNNMKLQSRKAGCVSCRPLSFCHSSLSVLHFPFMHFLRSSFARHTHLVWRLTKDERIAEQMWVDFQGQRMAIKCDRNGNASFSAWQQAGQGHLESCDDESVWNGVFLSYCVQLSCNKL